MIQVSVNERNEIAITGKTETEPTPLCQLTDDYKPQAGDQLVKGHVEIAVDEIYGDEVHFRKWRRNGFEGAYRLPACKFAAMAVAEKALLTRTQA